jgi:PTS system nitrogen regulatory IIA component
MSDEDFDVQSLATYLHLTPGQVEKMAGRDQLPGRRIAGQWRFSRSEIHHWFEERIGLSDDEQLEHVEKVLETSATTPRDSIAGLLEPSAIWIPLPARTRNSVIKQMCQRAADAGLVWDVTKMEEAIKSRENLHPTALGNGVALLHPRRPQPSNIAHAFLALGVTTTGLPFGGPRGVMTDVFFLIASDQEKRHLQTLARLSRIIAVPDFVEQLRACPDAAAACQLIRETDESLD